MRYQVLFYNLAIWRGTLSECLNFLSNLTGESALRAVQSGYTIEVL